MPNRPTSAAVSTSATRLLGVSSPDQPAGPPSQAGGAKTEQQRQEKVRNGYWVVACPDRLVQGQCHRGKCGEGAQQPRSQACPQPEGCPGAGHPQGGQGGKDKAAACVDPQGCPRHRAGCIGESEAQAIPELSTCKASDGDRQPRPAGRYAGCHLSRPRGGIRGGNGRCEPTGRR